MSRRLPRLPALGLLIATLLGGSLGATPSPDSPSQRALFIGNSLTAGHQLPWIVQAMAASAGVSMEIGVATQPGVALEDHWHAGTRRALAERWDVVILQQGPSTLPESRAHLIRWSGRWAKEIRKGSARPALFMVWPQRGQEQGFARVAASYRAAAEAHDTLLYAVGEAWERALGLDPRLELYTADGLHPTLAGSYLAALVIAHELLGIDPLAVPSRLRLDTGSTIELPDEVVGVLRAAAVDSPVAND